MQIFSISITLLILTSFWKYLNIYVKIISIIIYSFFELCYILTTFKNPGIIPVQYYLENYEVDKMKVVNYRVCRNCNIVMDLDKGVEHCSTCNICIIGNDHHCPWTTKCVGKNNILIFKIFLVSLSLYMTFLFIIILIMPLITFDNKKKKI